MKFTHALGGTIAALTAAMVSMAALAQPASAPVAAEFLDAVRADTQWLAGFPSRVPGLAGGEQAAAGLLARARKALTDGGVPAEKVDEYIWVHKFPVVVPRYEPATLTVTEGGQKGEHRVYPLWPAMVRLNTTPPEGISGRLIYVWKARHEHLPARSLRGQIAVMEFSGGGAWRYAYNAGAKAIILLGFDPAKPHANTRVPVRGSGSDELTEMTFAHAVQHLSRMPLNVPRFYVPDGPLAERLRTLTAGSSRYALGRLHASGAWVQKDATNLYVLLRPGAAGEQDRLAAVAADRARDAAGRIDALKRLKDSLRENGCLVYGPKRGALYDLADEKKQRDPTLRDAARQLWHEQEKGSGRWLWKRELTEGRRAIAFGVAYDGMSIVPQLAPGADAAVDAATLLGLLRHFAAHRPKRPIAFLFIDAFSINQRGVREMLNTLMTPWLDKTRHRHREDDRALAEEYARYEELVERLAARAREPGAEAHLAPKAVHAPEFAELHRFIKDEAARAVVAVEAVLHPARLSLSEMQKAVKQGRTFETGPVEDLSAAVEARRKLVARYAADVKAIAEEKAKAAGSKSLADERQRIQRYDTLLAEQKHQTLKLELTKLAVDELSQLRSAIIAARQQLITADKVNPTPERLFLWQRFMDILRGQLAETDVGDNKREALSLWIWNRAERRVRGQSAEANARHGNYWRRDRIQAEMLHRLGLLDNLDPPGHDHQARRHRPFAFLMGLDLSDAGVAAGPRMYCTYLQQVETSNAKSFSRWLDRFRRDKRLGEIWPADELAAVNLAPLAGQDHSSSHDVTAVASFTSPAFSFATPAVSWATLDALKSRCDTPRDRAELLDWARLRPQILATASLIRRMVNQTDFQVTDNPSSKWSRVRAVMVDRSPGEPVPRVPMAGYLTTLASAYVRGGRATFRWRLDCPGVRLREFAFTGRDGRAYFDALPAKAHANAKLFTLQSYKLAADGSILRAVDANKVGKGVRLDVNIEETNPTLRRAVVFTCRHFNVLEMFDPRFLLHLPSGSVLDARRASKPQRMNMMMHGGNVSCLLEPGTRWQLILRAGTTQNRMTLLGISEVPEQLSMSDEMRQGGFELHEQLPAVPMEVSVRDIYRLNERRLKAFRRAGISSEPIEQIHRRTAKILATDEAATRPATGPAAGAAEPDTVARAKRLDDGAMLARTASGALANEVRAYQAVQDTANDVVRAAIFLLLALAPFSFAMERLLFASPFIYKQIGFMALIFAAMTAILWSFHPAFRLSNQPMMIIMAFGIIFMSLLVISIVYRKFESGLEEMRSGRAESSGARTSRGGLAASAIRLGIANMRKRKLRTALTGITVVLITFALLCFTSVSSYVGKRELTLDESVRSPYTGILIRQPMGRQMPDEALGYTVNVLGGKAERIVPRYWWCHTSQAQWRLHVRDARSGKQISLVAALGLAEGEEKLTGVDRLLPDWEQFVREGGCYLSEAAAVSLGVGAGDTVVVAGREVPLRGVYSYSLFLRRRWDAEQEQHVLDGCYMSDLAMRQRGNQIGDTIEIDVTVDDTPEHLAVPIVGDMADKQRDNPDGIYRVMNDLAREVFTMTGEPIVPTDYSRLGEEQRTLVRQTNLDQLAQEMQSGGGLEPDQDLPRVRSDELIILPVDMLQSGIANCTLRSIAVQIADAKAAAEEMAGRVAFPVYHGTANGRAKVLASTPLQAVAPKSLWIVLIIAGLIVFNTMLNSIAERKKEIHIYTSLGLSPMHVGVLFLAEAMTYGLMGAIFGYIVGQGAATLLSNLKLMGGITLNYSGTQAIATMLMVMAIVVVSSLVPAFMAGKLASPSEEMKWRVPKPVNDRIRDTLPFTVTRQTANGVAMFLYEYMDAHREGSIGHFSTDNLRSFTAGLSPSPPVGPRPSEAAAGKAEEGGDSIERIADRRERGQPPPQPAEAREGMGTGPKAGPAGELLGIEATVWLAPYDLGVRQGVRLMIRPTEDPDVLEIDVELTREAGQVRSWQKLNKVFLGDLRRQLLGWRKLKTKRILAYIATGAEVLSRSGGGLEHLPGLMDAMMPKARPMEPAKPPAAEGVEGESAEPAEDEQTDAKADDS